MSFFHKGQSMKGSGQMRSGLGCPDTCNSEGIWTVTIGRGSRNKRQKRGSRHAGNSI